MLKIREYKELILNHRFYEAHEVLEEFWFPRRKEKTPTTLIVKGFINAAVAFELKKRAREKRAIVVWGNYIKFMKLLDKEPKEELLELKSFIDNFANNYLFNNS